MKKIQVAMITLMLAIVMSISSLFGCSLVTTNSKRDLDQIVATVKVYADIDKEEITKRDLVSAYINNYQGDSSEEYVDGIVDNLISNKVIIQYAKNYFAVKMNITENKSDVMSYFTDNEYVTSEDKLDAKYSAYKAINDYIDSFKEHDHDGEKVQDTYSGSVRAVPTGATNEDTTDKSAYIKKYESGVKADGREDAFAKAIKNLKENYLADDYDGSDITTTSYFTDMEKSYYESKLVECLERDLIKEARKTISYQAVANEYVRLYNEQKALSDTEYYEMLNNVSASNPVLSGRANTGMVYHILLKVDDATTTELNKIIEDNKYNTAKIESERITLFGKQTFTDLRSSWITSGYDFDGAKFTGDYTLCEGDAYAFQGNVTWLNEANKNDEDYKAEYRVDDLTKFSVEQVVDIVKNYVYGVDTTIDANKTDKIDKTITDYTGFTAPEDYEQRIKELIFAFSGDDSDSALNTYMGYAITPDSDKTYKAEFAKAGKELVDGKLVDGTPVGGNKKGTFKVAITDYGYHIMFFSKNFTGYDMPTLVDFMGKDATALEADLLEMLADWDNYEDKDNYMYILHGNLATNIANTLLNTTQQEIVNDCISDTAKVKIYKDTYKDLIK